MIDPRDFLKEPDPDLIDALSATGTFICQECLDPVGTAIIDEDEMELVYVCLSGHRNVASL